MPLLAYELGLQGNALDKDANGRGGVNRDFLVETRDPANALTAEGIPALRTVHPTITTYRLDAYRTRPNGNGQMIVSCLYSSDGRFILRKPDKDNPSWFDFGWQMRTVRVQLPIWVRERTYNPPEPDPVEVYRVALITRSDKRIVRTLRVRVEPTSTADFDIIAEQANSLHVMPDGNLYLFEGGTVTRVDDVAYDVVYTWVLDKGTIVPDSPRLLSIDESSPFPPDAATAYRPAYHAITVVQRGEATQQPPLRVLVPTYDKIGDGFGWQQLPGATRIV